MEVKVSVLMSVYRESVEEISRAIDSIINQTFKDFEFIIVIDDPNNTDAIDLIKLKAKSDGRIVLIENEKKLCLAASLNKGLEIAKGIFVARMDADDEAVSVRLEEQFAFMQKNCEIDLLFSWVDYVDGDGRRIFEFKPQRSKVRKIEKYFFEEHLLVHPSLMAKSEFLKKMKYDGKFERSQDFELWLRCIGNCNFDLVEKVLLRYKISNKDDIKGRIRKVGNFNLWTLKALNKNFQKHFYNYNFLVFYIKTLTIYLLLKITPKLLIGFIVKIKDKFE